MASLPMPMTSQPVSGRGIGVRWLLGACAVVLMHLALALTLPQQGWVTCAGIIGVLTLGVMYSLDTARHVSGQLRLKWCLLGVALLLWIGGFFATVYGEYFLRFDPPGAWLNQLLFAYRGLPLLLALCWPDDKDGPQEFAWFDVLQLSLIGVLFTLLFFPQISIAQSAGLWPVASSTAQAELYAANLVIVVVGTARLYATRVQLAVDFYRPVCALMGAHLVLSWWLNKFAIEQWHVTVGSVWFVLADVPVVLFFGAVCVSAKRFTALSQMRRQNAVMLAIRIASPAIYTTSVVCLGLAMILSGRNLWLGVTSIMMGLSVYFLRSMMMQVQSALSHEQLHKANAALEVMSQRDALTGLYNRRWFPDALASEWRRAQRNRYALTLLLIDIDHFKMLNDAFGHAAGDECLIAVAEMLERHLHREGDAVARFGGEEFVVILPQTDLEGAEVVADKLRIAIAEMEMEHPEAGVVTVSIGGASQMVSTESDGPDTLLLLADAALYEAKRKGRNRVQVVRWGGGREAVEPDVEPMRESAC